MPRQWVTVFTQIRWHSVQFRMHSSMLTAMASPSGSGCDDTPNMPGRDRLLLFRAPNPAISYPQPHIRNVVGRLVSRPRNKVPFSPFVFSNDGVGPFGPNERFGSGVAVVKVGSGVAVVKVASDR